MKKHTSEQLIPIQWFWTDTYGRKMSFSSWLKSRPFSIIYLVVIWLVIGIFGFGSSRHCEGTWQLSLICDMAIWAPKLVSAPLEYFLSAFTAPFFHNAVDHIIFVSVLGVLMPIQSFEVQYGSRATMIVFFVSYLFINAFFGTFINVGISIWPESPFYIYAMNRNWMGGSVGLYGIIGSLAYFSQKKWVLPLLIICFEIFNLSVIGISYHISLIHSISFIGGFVIAILLQKAKVIEPYSRKMPHEKEVLI